MPPIGPIVSEAGVSTAVDRPGAAIAGSAEKGTGASATRAVGAGSESRPGPTSLITRALPPPAAITAAPTSALLVIAAPSDSLDAKIDDSGKRRSNGSGSRKPR